MSHVLRTEFLIYGDDLDHTWVSSRIGLLPSLTWSKGKRIREPVGPVMKDNGWILKFNLDPYTGLEEQISVIDDLMEKHWDGFVEVCSRFESELSIIVELDESAEESLPALHLDKRFIKKMALLSTEIDIDLYLFEREHAEKRGRS